MFLFCCRQNPAYEMRISDWSSDVCSSDLAFDRIGDATSHQLQAVVRIGLELAPGKAVADQRAVEQVAGIIAGKRPAGAVGTLQARREADDQQRGKLGRASCRERVCQYV